MNTYDRDIIISADGDNDTENNVEELGDREYRFRLSGYPPIENAIAISLVMVVDAIQQPDMPEFDSNTDGLYYSTDGGITWSFQSWGYPVNLGPVGYSMAAMPAHINTGPLAGTGITCSIINGTSTICFTRAAGPFMLKLTGAFAKILGYGPGDEYSSFLTTSLRWSIPLGSHLILPSQSIIIRGYPSTYHIALLDPPANVQQRTVSNSLDISPLNILATVPMISSIGPVTFQAFTPLAISFTEMVPVLDSITLAFVAFNGEGKGWSKMSLPTGDDMTMVLRVTCMEP